MALVYKVQRCLTPKALPRTWHVVARGNKDYCIGFAQGLLHAHPEDRDGLRVVISEITVWPVDQMKNLGGENQQ